MSVGARHGRHFPASCLSPKSRPLTRCLANLPHPRNWHPCITAHSTTRTERGRHSGTTKACRSYLALVQIDSEAGSVPGHSPTGLQNVETDAVAPAADGSLQAVPCESVFMWYHAVKETAARHWTSFGIVPCARSDCAPKPRSCSSCKSCREVFRLGPARAEIERWFAADSAGVGKASRLGVVTLPATLLRQCGDRLRRRWAYNPADKRRQQKHGSLWDGVRQVPPNEKPIGLQSRFWSRPRQR